MTSRNIFFGTTSQGKISFDIVTGNFTLGNSNTDLIHINSNTNMGVGFTTIQTPTFRLDVSGGDINTDGSYRINGIEVLTSSGLGSGITSIGPIDSSVINNDLTVDGNTLYVDSSGNQVGIGTTAPNFTLDVNGSASIGTTLVVEGDLTVNGTLTTLNTETLVIEDPLIKLAKSNTADTLDIGFYGLYNDGISKYSGIFRDASDEVFKFFTGTTIEPTTTIDITPANGYTSATILVGHITAATTTVSNDLIVDTDTLFVDSSADAVGINNATPSEALDVVGNIGISGNIIPTLDAEFDLGTTTLRFREVFLSSGTLHIGGGQIGGGSGSDISITNNLTVENNCTIVGDLNVTGAFTTSGTVDIGDNLTLSGTLNVTGTGTFETNLVIVGDLLVDTNTLFVDSGANQVGIGTTGPTVPLDVVGDINTSTDYNVGGVQVLSSTTLGSAVVNSSLTNVGTLTSLEISGNLLVDTDTLFVDSSLNRVGIGTTGPLFELDVSGDINSTGSDYRVNGTSVLNATTLGSSVINSSLTSNTGNLTNTGTMNVTTGNDYQINSVSVLNATTLGGAVIASSLTSVGTLTTLDVSGDLAVDSNTLYVDASVNSVGIGITIPVSKLDIVANTANDGDETTTHGIRIQTSSTNQSLMMGYDGTDDISYINSGKTGSITSLTLQTRGGNVGIGITNPSFELDVFGDINFTGILFQNAITVDATIWSSSGINVFNTNSGNVGINNTSASELFTVGNLSTASSGENEGVVSIQGSNGTSGDFRTWNFKVGTTSTGTSTFDTQRLRILDGTTERMTIDSNGDVGIGTDTPAFRLEVVDLVNETVARFGGTPNANHWVAFGDGVQRVRVGYSPITNLPIDNVLPAQVLANSTGDLLLSTRTNLSSRVRMFTSTGTTAIERSRIDNDNIQFFSGSTDNNDSVLQLRAAHIGTTNARYIEFFTSATSTTTGTSEGFITTDGSGNLAFLDTSDRRLKQNIIEYDNGDEIIKLLRVVKYDWKDNKKPNDCLGFIAQEVQEVLPKSVSKFKNGYLGMSRIEMIPIMWSALRRSLKEIDELKLRINQLESNPSSQ